MVLYIHREGVGGGGGGGSIVDIVGLLCLLLRGYSGVNYQENFSIFRQISPQKC